MEKTKSDIISKTESFGLMTNLLKAAFFSVAYLRRFFHHDCFAIASMGPFRYHDLVDMQSVEVAHYVDCLQEGVFDALRKQYLDKVLLEVFARAPGPAKAKGKPKSPKQTDLQQLSSHRGELLECFSFGFNYDSDGAQLLLGKEGKVAATSRPSASKQEIKANAGSVLRTLLELTETLEPLPQNKIISMKILYKDHTPDAYEPPHFMRAMEQHQRWFEEQPIRVNAGRVSTPFHHLSFSIRARASAENEDARVLRKREIPSMDHTVQQTMTILDVGGSEGNSGRVALPPGPMRETQDFMEREEVSAPTTKMEKQVPWKRKGSGEMSQKTGGRKKRRGESYGTKGGWSTSAGTALAQKRTKKASVAGRVPRGDGRTKNS